MTAIRPPHTHAPAQRMHEIQVTPPVGKPVTLRVRGMTLGGAGAVQLKTPASSALSSAIKTALGPTTTQPHAHVARVMPVGAALELPGPMQTIANAAQALPEALRGTLIRGAFALLGPRLMTAALPTVTLATMLYSPSVGDASLSMPPRARDSEPDATSTAFVPLAPHGLEHAEGFKPVNANDPKLYGPPASEFTRPPTPPTRVLPQTHTTTPEPLEGGPPVEAPTVPGKAQQVPHWADSVHLATEKPLGPVTSSHSETGQPVKEKLTFTDVVVSEQKVKVGDNHGLLVPDKRLHLKFQTSAYGEGEISVRWPDLFDRRAVQVEFKKTSRLPDGAAGEILAHALAYTYEFIPQQSLQLKIENIDSPIPVSKEFVSAVMRWAAAMHGKKTSSIELLNTGYTMSWMEAGFVAAPRFFEKPTTRSGDTADEPELGDPKIFVNPYPWHSRPRSIDELAPDIFPPQGLTAAVQRRHPELPAAVAFIYVIPVPAHAQDPVLPHVGSLDVSLDVHHRDLAQGGPALGAGYGHAVYDPHFGPSGGYRTQFLTDPGLFAARGKKTKKASETALQEVLDAGGRWFPRHEPVSIAPFAGLQVRRESTQYIVKIPDARALSYRGGPLQHDSARYPDLASMVIEPIERQAGQPPLARVSQLAVDNEMRSFLPTFVGQALNAVHLTHPVTGKEQAFGGIRLSQEVFGGALEEFAREFVEGLTVYGLEKKLGMYSPDVPFVLQREAGGDIEFIINPAVRTSR